jgi:hypothetical protein
LIGNVALCALTYFTQPNIRPTIIPTYIFYPNLVIVA